MAEREEVKAREANKGRALCARTLPPGSLRRAEEQAHRLSPSDWFPPLMYQALTIGAAA